MSDEKVKKVKEFIRDMHTVEITRDTENITDTKVIIDGVDMSHFIYAAVVGVCADDLTTDVQVVFSPRVLTTRIKNCNILPTCEDVELEVLIDYIDLLRNRSDSYSTTLSEYMKTSIRMDRASRALSLGDEYATLSGEYEGDQTKNLDKKGTE